MSHFTVMVVTRTSTQEALAAALQPFHEFECTGCDDEYIQNVAQYDETKKEYDAIQEKDMTYAEFLNADYGRKSILPGEALDLEKDHKYGYVILDDEGEVIDDIQRTNPNSKWDWWQVGGRYKNHLIARGVSCDQALKCQINLDQIQDRECEKFRDKWRRVRNVVGEHGKTFISWEGCLAKFEGDVALARDFYHAQPAHAALRMTKDRMLIFERIDDYMCSEQEGGDKARKDALSTFALLDLDGTWHDRGQMGWFGVVHDEDDHWTGRFDALYEAIPDDAFITIVDCHI